MGITEIIKLFVAINTSTPNADYVHVCRGYMPHHFRQFLPRLHRKMVRWNHIGAAQLNGFTIHFTSKGTAKIILFSQPL